MPLAAVAAFRHDAFAAADADGAPPMPRHADVAAPATPPRAIAMQSLL